MNVLDEPLWLEDGSFLWRSERTGFAHLYHYEANGSLRRQLTDGEWEIRSLHGVDESAESKVFFTSIEHSPIAPHVYSMPLGGGERRRLSAFRGLAPRVVLAGHEVLSRYLQLGDPSVAPRALREPVATVCASSATRRPTRSPQVEWGDVEFLQVPTEDGFPMEAMIIKPPGFDASKKYPVFQYNYGGPAAPGRAQRLGRHPLPVAPDAGPGGLRHLDVRQPLGVGQGRSLHLAGLPEARRDRAPGHRGRTRLAASNRAGSTPIGSVSGVGATAASWPPTP